MNAQDIVILAILVAIIAIAVHGIVKRIRFGSACCGTKEPPEKKIRVKDKNKAHYGYRYILSVDGMRCSGCARRVENAFNKTEGRWAKADIEKKEVRLLSKKEEKENDLAGITSAAGYTMLSCVRG